MPCWLQSRIARVAAWISPALLVARPLTGALTFLFEGKKPKHFWLKNVHHFIQKLAQNQHHSHWNEKKSQRKSGENLSKWTNYIFFWTNNENIHEMIIVVENSVSSTCTRLPITKAGAINPNVDVTIIVDDEILVFPIVAIPVTHFLSFETNSLVIELGRKPKSECVSSFTVVSFLNEKKMVEVIKGNEMCGFCCMLFSFKWKSPCVCVFYDRVSCVHTWKHVHTHVGMRKSEWKGAAKYQLHGNHSQ